ncbi:hypothetical protein BJX70DRAFT_91888 [Aspergillus crustosus]
MSPERTGPPSNIVYALQPPLFTWLLTCTLPQIAEIRECLDSDDSLSQMLNNDGPALLLGLCPLGGIEDILALVLLKSVAGRLVSRFFNSMEPGVLVFHAPTFQKEYNQFWTQPQDNRYTTPSKYNIEALFTYAQCEYFRSAETRHENWVLLELILRLAFHVGLHRDGSRYQGISCFEAEMRRRTWAFMAQGDVLSPFQSGPPRMLQKRLVDTKLPRNLLDENFDENTKTLPLPRPDSDATPISYVTAKSGFSDIFGLMTDHVASTQPNTHGFVLELPKYEWLYGTARRHQTCIEN